MGRSQRTFVLSLLAGGLVLVVSVFGFVGMLGRPDIPWDELAQQTGIPAEDLPGAALRVDGFPVVDVPQIHTYCDLYNWVTPAVTLKKYNRFLRTQYGKP